MSKALILDMIKLNSVEVDASATPPTGAVANLTGARGKRRGFSPGAAARPLIGPEQGGDLPKKKFKLCIDFFWLFNGIGPEQGGDLSICF